MDGSMVPWAAWAGNIFLYVLGVGVIRSYLLDLKKDRDDLWKALHGHGHKGLDTNGSRVTRGS
jgi:hypothetical protein